MSVIITGMEIPKSCSFCDLSDSLTICPCYYMDHDEFWTNKQIQWNRHPNCPLVAINTEHPENIKLLDEKIGVLLDAITKAQDALSIVRRI